MITKRQLAQIRERVDSAVRELSYHDFLAPQDAAHVSDIVETDLSIALSDLDYCLELCND
jgi:hypothetical protein